MGAVIGGCDPSSSQCFVGQRELLEQQPAGNEFSRLNPQNLLCVVCSGLLGFISLSSDVVWRLEEIFQPDELSQSTSKVDFPKVSQKRTGHPTFGARVLT